MFCFLSVGAVGGVTCLLTGRPIGRTLVPRVAAVFFFSPCLYRGGPFGLAPNAGGAPGDFVDRTGAEVPVAAALVMEHNVLDGGAGTDDVLCGPVSEAPWF